ncbi:MAG: HAD family phosphatase [Firmicutes bacterium]|nr:HAD family phosphatase [Bacillota bacterium]
MRIIGNDGKEKQIEGIIFDLDGTLLDSMKIWDTIGNDYIESLGITAEENLAVTFKDMSMEQSAEYYRSVYGVDKSSEEIISEINEMIAVFYKEKAELKEGVNDFLEACRLQGIPMCIATATSKVLVEAALKRLNILHFFKKVLTCGEVGKGKDSREIFDQALKCLGTDMGRTPVFEDALHAARTAKNAGFYVIGVFDPSEPYQNEMKQTSDIYVNRINDLKIK